jgi:hypothetical protein
MKPQTAIQKGKELEDFIVDRLRLAGLDRRAYRQKGSGSGKAKGDVWNDLNIHFEAKNQKNFGGKAWFNQMTEENVSYLKECLVWHMPNTPLESSKVIIDWDYYEELLKKTKEPPTQETSKELRWRLKRFLEYAKDLIKELEN